MVLLLFKVIIMIHSHPGGFLKYPQGVCSKVLGSKEIREDTVKKEERAATFSETYWQKKRCWPKPIKLHQPRWGVVSVAGLFLSSDTNRASEIILKKKREIKNETSQKLTTYNKLQFVDTVISEIKCERVTVDQHW